MRSHSGTEKQVAANGINPMRTAPNEGRFTSMLQKIRYRQANSLVVTISELVPALVIQHQ